MLPTVQSWVQLDEEASDPAENDTAVTVNEVLHIQTLDRRLLAVPKIVKHWHNVWFDGKYCGIYKDNVLMISAKRMKSVYILDFCVEYEHAMLV